MKHISRLFTLTAAATLVAGVAQAQTIGIATTSAGSFTHSSGSAMAKVFAEYAGLRARVQPGSVSPSRPVNAGTADFGLGNSFDTTFFVTGKGEYEGQGPKKNLRVVGVLTPLRVGLFVRKDSPYTKIADLKGKRVSSGFNAQKTIGRIITAHLANGGLTYDDVQPVPAPNVVRAADDFGKGKVDVLFFALGSAAVLKASSKVGGVRLINIDDSPEAVARMEKILPGAYPMTVKPSKRLHGVEGPTKIIAFDFYVTTNRNVPEDVVYKATKALYNHKKELLASFKGLALFNPKKMYKKIQSVQFHPGALKFYKEIGLKPVM